jgi:exopolysaccharide biosynthesis polyprenyl glycosylphosphotransferase
MVSFWSQAEFSRAWVGLTWALALVFELVSRRLWAAQRGRMRASGDLALRTAVVGEPLEAYRRAERLAAIGSGFRPVGFISPGPVDDVAGDLAHLGTVDDLDTVLLEGQLDCLFIESNSVKENDALRVAAAARHHGAEVWLSASMPEILSSRVGIQPLGGTMAFSLRPVRLTGPQTVTKRVFDLVVAGFGLILISPLLAAIAVAVKVASRGPVLFRQERVTKEGRSFQMLKFRTMRHRDSGLGGADGADDTQAFFKTSDRDPSITRVGRLLRRMSLDELPQLLNVLRGEMSLVGPRPLPVRQVEKNKDMLGMRHEVPAGMTGWWQIQGRSELEAGDAVRLDLFYIENWSLSLDLYILLKTVGAVLSTRGAR